MRAVGRQVATAGPPTRDPRVPSQRCAGDRRGSAAWFPTRCGLRKRPELSGSLGLTGCTPPAPGGTAHMAAPAASWLECAQWRGRQVAEATWKSVFAGWRGDHRHVAGCARPTDSTGVSTSASGSRDALSTVPAVSCPQLSWRPAFLRTHCVLGAAASPSPDDSPSPAGMGVPSGPRRPWQPSGFACLSVQVASGVSGCDRDTAGVRFTHGEWPRALLRRKLTSQL